jgi:maleylacetate reductase
MFVDSFSYTAQPMRVIFGQGLMPLADELRSLGIRRAVVVCTPDRAELGHRVADIVGDLVGGVLADAVMHIPKDVVDRCESICGELGCDGYIAVGGGSAVGLAKALALRSGLPLVAVPTTYAGSEMTPVWGITENRIKTTGRHRSVLPSAVVYDPGLTVGLPVELSVVSGMNAIAHAVEALYAPDRSPIVSLMAREGAQELASALRTIVDHPEDLTARGKALYGAWLCGAVLGVTTMSLHHKLCHILGGSFNLPHAQTHAIILPHVLGYNAPFAPDMVAALTDVFGPGDPATSLWQLQRALPMSQALSDLGLMEPALDEVVELVMVSPYANPRPVDPESVRLLLGRAWRGDPPLPQNEDSISERVTSHAER